MFVHFRWILFNLCIDLISKFTESCSRAKRSGGMYKDIEDLMSVKSLEVQEIKPKFRE